MGGATPTQNSSMSVCKDTLNRLTLTPLLLPMWTWSMRTHWHRLIYFVKMKQACGWKNSNIRNYEACVFLNVTVKGVTWNTQMLVLRARDWAFITACCWGRVLSIADPVSSVHPRERPANSLHIHDFAGLRHLCPGEVISLVGLVRFKSEFGHWDWVTDCFSDWRWMNGNGWLWCWHWSDEILND